MTREQVVAALDDIEATVADAFPHAPRLADFAKHIATVRMVAEHIFDEDARSRPEPQKQEETA
jgi:hypothetical protein